MKSSFSFANLKSPKNLNTLYISEFSDQVDKASQLNVERPKFDVSKLFIAWKPFNRPQYLKSMIEKSKIKAKPKTSLSLFRKKSKK